MTDKPNILIIWGDDIGQSNLSCYSDGVMGYRTKNIDRIAAEGARFTDWARRPLDKRQIDYAIGDVTHLAKLFPKMLERLRKTGRGQWLDQEMDKLRRNSFRELLGSDWKHGVEPAVDIALLGRYYERIADHAVSIARRVVFLVTGEHPQYA